MALANSQFMLSRANFELCVNDLVHNITKEEFNKANTLLCRVFDGFDRTNASEVDCRELSVP